MHILLAGSYWNDKEATFSAMVGDDHQISRWHLSEGFDSFRAALRTAEVLVLSQDVAVDGQFVNYLQEGASLRLMHLPFAGYDRLPRDRVPEYCQVCNVHEHSSAIAEYVLAGMLEMAIGLREKGYGVWQA